LAVLTELARCGQLEPQAAAKAMDELGIKADARFSAVS
jgi:hypothetical protein